MNKFVLLVVFVVAATCTAYDFKDSSFNEYILEDFKELSDQLEAPHPSRFRRDTEEPEDCMRKREYGVKCCNYKPNPKPYEILRETKKQCFKEIVGDGDDFHTDPFNCEKWGELKNQMICIGECIGRKLELVDDNGDMNRDALIEHMKEKFSDPETQWKLDASEEIVDKCLGQLQSSEDSTSAQKCNPSALKTAHCMWREFVKACPKELQVESIKCTRLREKLEKDDVGLARGFYLPHFHLHDDKK